MGRAFVIRPFGTRKDSSGRELDFERVHRELVAPALDATGFGGGTTGEIVDSGNIREDMFALILEADLVVCDITLHNANVFYELGIRHGLRKKWTLLIRGRPTQDDTPFDLLTDRYLTYPVDEPSRARDELTRMITASLSSERTTDSPVFQLLPSLPEVDPSKGQDIVPLDFREEIGRARAAQKGARKVSSRGWLRLLSEEVRERRFQREGLKLVARAQLDLKDWEGARQSWEAVRELQPGDLDANQALANVYERIYREEGRPEQLEASDQAIRRVLASPGKDRKTKAEALALHARNEKTRWRREFEHLETVEERRRTAVNRALVRAYDSYRSAYLEDLNHSWSGLAALQMGLITLDLSGLPEWLEAFSSDREARARKEAVAEEVEGLRAQVPLAVQAELRQLAPSDPERFWVEITGADLQFLTSEGKNERIVRSYLDAIPLDKPFAWDAARGQLDLFRRLGFKADLASEIIARVDTSFAGRQRAPAPARDESKPVHLLLLAGHRIDASDRPVSRFPPSKEEKARVLIAEAVKALVDVELELVGLASAAPGTDILAHETLAELGIPSIICLPMPAKAYAREAFGDLDSWRTRFLKLLEGREVLELSDREGLPRWLHGSGIDPWERGNRWVTRLAQTWGASRITLVALWDGKQGGDAAGGTAQMVQLARDAGDIRVVHVDARRLLE